MSAARELWQGYNEEGEPLTDKGLTKQQCAAGALHGSADMWVWRMRDGEMQVLLQKRADDIKTWPGYLDAAAAGHIDFGETPLESALRETKEELGIDIDQKDVELLFVHRQELRYGPANITENEIQWVYGYDLTGRDTFELEKKEVKSVGWVSFRTLEHLIAGKIAGARIIPHDKAYFTELVMELKQLAG